jgi:carbon-monoxide dehydrogenase medium subunit
LKPPAFDYIRPSSVAEAVAALAAAPEESKVLAGGQSLVPLMNFRLAEPTTIVDINDVAGLSFIDPGSRVLRIGALTRTRQLELSQVAANLFPILAHAAHWVGHVQIRNRGTVGGSVAHGDPAAEMPAMCVLLDAEIMLTGPTGSRVVRAADFFTGFLSTAIAPDELLTEIGFPLPGPRARWGFSEFAQRRGDFALAGAGCLLDADTSSAQIVAFGPTDRPMRCHAAEAVIRERDFVLSPDTVRIAAIAAVDEVRTRMSVDDSETRHRFDLVEPMVTRALQQAAATPGDLQ